MNEAVMLKIIEALRDCAAKVTETKTIKRTRFKDVDQFGYQRPRNETEEYEEQVEAYSKEWLSGRLLGMADMLDTIKEMRQ